MKFIFWQNVVSIHQSAFIKALAERHDVTLVAAEKIDEERVREKWDVPSMGRATVIVAPTDDQISNLISCIDARHVFSGINAYPLVYRAFKSAVRNGLHVSIMVEPFEWTGMKGLMRRCMYFMLYLRYGSNIDYIFATGDMGVNCYRKAGFSGRKIHQWGYFTEQKEHDLKTIDSCELPSLIFIGKIDGRKNILELARCAVKLSSKFEKMTIIGTGPLESELNRILNDSPNIKFIGPVPNNEIAHHLAESDLLILPSLFDGWGAVVNEALSQGTRVLCSDRCGAKALLDGQNRGGVFSLDEANGLYDGLKYWVSRGPVDRHTRIEIAQWARNHISGTIAAKYFYNTMTGLDLSAPWTV